MPEYGWELGEDEPLDVGEAEYDVDAYARQLRALLPRGQAWEIETGSKRYKFLLGIATEFARIGTRAADLLREWDPRTADETIADWERVLGLPDACFDTVPEALEDRQVAAAAKLAARGGQDIPFFIALAVAQGYPATVTELGPARCGTARCGDRCYGVEWIFVFQVNLDLGGDPLPYTGENARCGTARCGDRFTDFEELPVQCVIRRAAPAHTLVLFSFINFT